MISFDEFRRWVEIELTRLYGDRIISVHLTGSRARGLERPDSDWDVLVILRNAKTIADTGPLIHDRLKAPDGNIVEVLRCDPASWNKPNPKHQFITDCKASGLLLFSGAP